MRASDPVSPSSFTTFGELLKYLRRREHLTQLELSIKVGYSEAQISRLEKNQRLPDPTGIKALFIPALHLEDEPEFAARLVELAQSARQADAPAPGIAPYKGLLYFDESDSELFFGREALTESLVKHVMDLALDAPSRFLAVVGASGSGKSSLVRAGLAVALRRTGWEVLVFTPTVHPLQQLEPRLSSARRENGGRVLILVDQFEEVFTLCRDEVERITFIEKLLTCAQEKSKKFSVVIALRADFYAHCSQYPLLRQAVAVEQEFIGQMTIDELKQAIEEPAKRNGWEFELGLVDMLLHDLSSHGSNEPEPGALPLLSHALLATWERRHGRILTIEGYHASGGVRGAIAETAESVFTDQLNQNQQEIAHDVFLRLTELGEGTEDTRRRVTLNEMVRESEEAAQLRAVLNTLAEARLITLNEDSAEVAHEALIREWHRLHEWLTQDREGLLLHRHLTDSALEWERRGRDVAELFRGARLAQTQEWASANAARLNQVERDFLAASIDQEQHEALEREAQRQREVEAAQSLAEAERQRAEEQLKSAHHLRRRAIYLGFSLVGAFLLLLVAIAFARQAGSNAGLANKNLSAAQSAEQQALSQQATAESERLRAEGESQLATARELASNALVNLKVDSDRSILLALQAVKTADIPETENALHQAVLNARLRDTLTASTQPLSGVAFSPNNAPGAGRLATVSQDGTIKIWQVDETSMKVSRDPLVTISNPLDSDLAAASGYTLAFSPDGMRLAAISSAHTAKIWDAASGKLLNVLTGHNGAIIGIAFSPTEELVATASVDGGAKIWDAHTGKELQTLPVTASGSVVFSLDGKRLAVSSTSRGTVTVWDRIDESNNPSSVTPFARSFSFDSQMSIISALGFSPDGKQLAVGDNDIEVYDISSVSINSPARLLVNIPTAHQCSMNALFYSPDGSRLISGSCDGNIKVWDAQTGQALFTLPPDVGMVLSATQTSDGKLLFTAHVNGQVKVWDVSVEGNQEWLTIPDIAMQYQTRSGNRLVNLNSNPDSPNLQVAGLSPAKLQILELSPAGTHEISSTLIFLEQGLHNYNNLLINHFDVDPALTRLAVFFPGDATVRVMELPSGKELSSIHALINIYDVKFSPDGTRLVTGNSDGTVFILDVNNGHRLRRLTGHTGYFFGWQSVDFSPDGALIATANSDGSVRIWDAYTGTQLHNLPGHSGAYANVVFSKDGKHLLATGEGSTVNLWDVQTGEKLLTLQLPTYVTNLEYSPDGKYLAIGRMDGIMQMWDASTGQELLTLPGYYVKFTEDGKHLLALVNNMGTNVLYGYSLDINELMQIASTCLTRTWTPEECSKYLHTAACPASP